MQYLQLVQGRVVFEQNGSTIEGYFISERGRYASVYSWEVAETKTVTPEALYERWAYSKVKKDSFTITVQKTTFWEIGEEITFHKREQ